MSQFLHFLDALGDVVAYLFVWVMLLGSFAACVWPIYNFIEQVVRHRRTL